MKSQESANCPKRSQPDARLPFDWQPGGLPRLPATGEGARLFPPRPLEFSRRTDACCFIRSGTKKNDPALTRDVQLGNPTRDLIRRYAHRPLGLKLAGV